MTRRSIRLSIVILALAAIAGGFYLWDYFAQWESTDDAQVEGHIHPVNTQIGGTVIAVHVEDNDVVEAGQVLVEIDRRDMEIAVARAEAELANARAEAAAARAEVPLASSSSGTRVDAAQASESQARAGVAAAEREILAAEARLQAARSQVEKAETAASMAQADLGRMEQLVARDEISRQAYDAAVTAADSARAGVDAAQAAVLQAEHEVAAAEARRDQSRAGLAAAAAETEGSRTAPQEVVVVRARADSAEARVRLAEAAVEQARLDLERTTIVAPASGMVSKRSVEAGQVVQAGQPIMAIVPEGDVWVVANFKETQLSNMRVGQAAVVSIDAYGGREYEAHIESISAATGARFSLLPPENATGNYVKVVQRIPVRIALDPDGLGNQPLRPGMSAVVAVKFR